MEGNVGVFGAVVNSIKSVLFGGILVLVTFPVIYWNEGRARQTALSLDEGLSAVVHIDAAAPSQDGKLVHFQGQASTTETLADPTFGVRQTAIRLRRTVEVYQWIEDKQTENKSGGGTRAVYRYDQKWHEGLVRDQNFHDRTGHTNPTSVPFESQEFQASVVTVGALRLAPDLVGQMTDWQTVRLAAADDAALPPLPAGAPTRLEDQWYFAADPISPRIGDLRVGFAMVPPAPVSVVARQNGTIADAYPTQAGDELAMLEMGDHPADQMFAHAVSLNNLLTWGLRALAFGMLFGGLALILSPITRLAGVVPFFGSWVRLFTSLIAGAAAFVLWGSAVAFAWILVRPLLAVALLFGVGVAGVAAIGLAILAFRGSRSS